MQMLEGRDTRMEIEIERTPGKGVMEEYTESQMQMVYRRGMARGCTSGMTVWLRS